MVGGSVSPLALAAAAGGWGDRGQILSNTKARKSGGVCCMG